VNNEFESILQGRGHVKLSVICLTMLHQLQELYVYVYGLLNDAESSYYNSNC
jgi:hypothetical protein